MTLSASPPRVVALVPTWRAAAFLEPTLEGLAAQTCPNLEIVISDDASPDDTVAICERYATNDARFRLIRQSRNLGWTGNVNALLAQARGDYLLFAFHDDVLAPAYIERCVGALEANPGAVMAYSDLSLVFEDGRREAMSYSHLEGVRGRVDRARLVALQRGSWWIPNRGVFRASAARAIGGLRRHLAGEFSADWPWLLRMSLLGEFVRVPQDLCTKVYTSQSLSQSWGYGVGPTLAVAWSAVRSVGRSGIAWREQLAVDAAITRFAWRPVRRAVDRGLGKLGGRRSVPESESSNAQRTNRAAR